MRTFYFVTAVLGLVLPYIFFVQFLAANGLDLPLFVRQMFAKPVPAFFSMDIIVSALAFWGFLYSEGRRLRMQRLWVYVLLNLLVGLSFALPVFLYVREGKQK